MDLRFTSIIYHYRKLIVLLWLIIAICCTPLLPHINKPFKVGGISDPNVESALTEKIMADKLAYGGSRVFILYESKILTVFDPHFIQEVKISLSGLKHFPHHYKILSPFANPTQISSDRHAAYAVMVLDKPAEVSSNWTDSIKEALGKPKTLKMYVGGEPVFIADVKKISQEDLFRAERIAFPLAIIILIVVFRSLIAALLPIISGAVGVICILSILNFLGRHFDISVFVLNIATMLGLGLSLDYTLFIVSRFREEINQGNAVSIALTVAYKTAGKAVLFSGITVLISMSALLFFPVNVIYSIGVGGVVVTIMSLLVALIFLPALLAVIGNYVNALTLPVPIWRKNLWYGMAMTIMKRPLLIFFSIMIFLVFLGYPFLHVKVNRPNATILPTHVESRQLYDEFHRLFGENELSPIYVLAKAKEASILTPENVESLYDFAHRLQKDSRVKRIDSIVTIDPKFSSRQYQYFYRLPSYALQPSLKEFLLKTTYEDLTLLSVISKYPVNDTQTFELIKTIRNSSIGNNIVVHVGGTSADISDTIHSLYKRFFQAMVIIGVVTYLVLLLLFRSVVLPFKAIIMNFLSLCVSYGMLVFIFQDGNFHQLLDFKPLGFTDMNLPILLFCGLFGLSMDYEVFLLTRIREFYLKTNDNALSVALGLERSGRIITYAALIVVVVCSAFITAEIVFVKAFGLGTALAVFIDATIIRSLLVPATMRLLGKWNWYMPKWLDRLLPKLDLS